MKKLLAAAAVGVAVYAGAGCGMNPQENYNKMRANLVARNFQAVDNYLNKVKDDIYDEDNRLLFYMDKGMVLHLAKKYKESNQFMEKAKQTAQDLWTESVGKNAAAWLTTDNSLPYQGEDFEKVLIHFLASLNYMGMGDYAGARVEARQMSSKLELITSKYEEGERHYKDDAFGRWLSGKLAETDAGEDSTAFNDAWIDYKKAITVYETDYAERYQVTVPQFLVADALRALEALGADFQTEYNELRSRFPTVEYKGRDETKGLGEIVFLHMAGEAPFKTDEFWDAQAGADWIRVAFPKYNMKKNRIMKCRITVQGNSGNSEIGEPVAQIAIQNLNDHMARIKAKAIARAVAKYIAAKATSEVGKQAGGTAGAIMQIGAFLFSTVSNIAEEADKRSWITLPSAVNVASVFAEPGQHQVEVALLGQSGQVVGKKMLPVEVKPDGVTFVSYRTFR